MSELLDLKTMDQAVADAEASGDTELAKDLRRIQAKLMHELDQMEERLRGEGRLGDED